MKSTLQSNSPILNPGPQSPGLHDKLHTFLMKGDEGFCIIHRQNPEDVDTGADRRIIVEIYNDASCSIANKECVCASEGEPLFRFPVASQADMQVIAAIRDGYSYSQYKDYCEKRNEEPSSEEGFNTITENISIGELFWDHMFGREQKKYLHYWLKEMPATVPLATH